jgi:hypothetical protein
MDIQRNDNAGQKEREMLRATRDLATAALNDMMTEDDEKLTLSAISGTPRRVSGLDLPGL